MQLCVPCTMAVAEMQLLKIRKFHYVVNSFIGIFLCFVFAWLPPCDLWFHRCNVYISKIAMISDQLSTQFFIFFFCVSLFAILDFIFRCSTDKIIVIQFYTITLWWFDYKIIITISFSLFVTISGSFSLCCSINVAFPFRHA